MEMIQLMQLGLPNTFSDPGAGYQVLMEKDCGLSEIGKAPEADPCAGSTNAR